MNKIKNSIIFKIKSGYKLELLSKETMELLGSLKNIIDQDKDGESVHKLDVEVVLVHFFMYLQCFSIIYFCT